MIYNKVNINELRIKINQISENIKKSNNEKLIILLNCIECIDSYIDCSKFDRLVFFLYIYYLVERNQLINSEEDTYRVINEIYEMITISNKVSLTSFISLFNKTLNEAEIKLSIANIESKEKKYICKSCDTPIKDLIYEIMYEFNLIDGKCYQVTFNDQYFSYSDHIIRGDFSYDILLYELLLNKNNIVNFEYDHLHNSDSYIISLEEINIKIDISSSKELNKINEIKEKYEFKEKYLPISRVKEVLLNNLIYDGEVNNTKKKKINIIDDIYFYNKETFRFIEINKHAIDTYDKIKKEIFNNEKDNFLLKKLINIINVLDYKLLFKIENSTKYIIFEKTISEKNVEKRFIAALNIDLDSSENIKTYIKKHNFTTLFDLFLDEYIENEAILWCNEQKIPYIIE